MNSVTTRAAERGAELAERAGPLRDGHGEQRLARLAELGALGDEAQPIEVHVGAAQHRRQPLPGRAPGARATHAFRPATASAPAGSMIAARVVEDVLDGGADLVVGHAHDFVDGLLRDARTVSSPTSRTATPSAKMPT